MIRFDGQVAVITGAGAGLGAAYARLLARRGAAVVVNDLGGSWDGRGGGAEPARAVVDDLQAEGGRAAANFDSVSEPESAERIIQTALDHFGRIDILICNAGVLRDKTFAKMTWEDFRLVLDVHLMGAAYTARPAFRVMKDQGYGRMVLTTSTAGLFGNFGQANYTAAKMGVVGLMNALKLEGARHDIKVNTVAPLAATRLSAPSGIFAEVDPEMIAPEMVAPLVAYLASRHCPTSGDVFSAGGGFFAKVQMMESPGLRLDDPGGVDPETVAARFDQITDMTGARWFPDAASEIDNALAPLKKR